MDAVGKGLTPALQYACPAATVKVDQCLMQRPWQSAVNKDAESKQQKHLK